MHVQNHLGTSFSQNKRPLRDAPHPPRAWFHYLPLFAVNHSTICRYLPLTIPLFAANHSAICCYLQLTIPLCAAIELLSKKIGWGFMLEPHTATGFNSSGWWSAYVRHTSQEIHPGSKQGPWQESEHMLRSGTPLHGSTRVPLPNARF